MKPRGIVIHTVGVKGDTTIDAIRKYHMTPDDPRTAVKEGNGWRDVGYHRFVRKGGLVEVGRALFTPGAHLEGANDTLGICVAGHGDVEPWTTEQTKAVIDLCVEWCAHFGWDSSHVVGHREGPARFGAKPTTKTCPGALVDMNAVRGLVELGLFVRRRSAV
jgi:N-acetylmuramoyl-L-alanine amidase-like protein